MCETDLYTSICTFPSEKNKTLRSAASFHVLAFFPPFSFWNFCLSSPSCNGLSPPGGVWEVVVGSQGWCSCGSFRLAEGLSCHGNNIKMIKLDSFPPPKPLWCFPFCQSQMQLSVRIYDRPLFWITFTSCLLVICFFIASTISLLARGKDGNLLKIDYYLYVLLPWHTDTVLYPIFSEGIKNTAFLSTLKHQICIQAGATSFLKRSDSAFKRLGFFISR